MTLAATDTSDINQVMIFDKETLRNPDSGKILNVNEGKVRSHWDEKGADIWEFVYSGNDGGSNSFGRLLYDNIRPKYFLFFFIMNIFFLFFRPIWHTRQ